MNSRHFCAGLILGMGSIGLLSFAIQSKVVTAQSNSSFKVDADKIYKMEGSKSNPVNVTESPIPSIPKRVEMSKLESIHSKVAPNPVTPNPLRRNETTIRIPSGSFIKEMEVNPYGNGRITWTYQGDRVLGFIEGSVMGIQFQISTEAEISLSSNGTIYGVMNSIKLNQIKFGGEHGAALQVYAPFVPLIEQVVCELFIDMPFSYQFRVNGDRLTILNYRALLAGPNPLLKFAPFIGDLKELGAMLIYFQGLGTAIEGSYQSVESKEKDAPRNRFNEMRSH